MLPLRKCWHNAPERAPETEARLLGIHSVNPNNGNSESSDTQEIEDEFEAAAYRGMEYARAHTPKNDDEKEIRKKITQQMETKLGGFGAALSAKIQEGITLGFHDLPADKKLRTAKLVLLFLDEHPDHKETYEAILLSTGELSPIYIDGFEAAYKAAKSAHEALLKTLANECKEFVKKNPDICKRSQEAVKAFKATKNDTPKIAEMLEKEETAILAAAYSVILEKTICNREKVAADIEALNQTLDETIKKMEEARETLKEKFSEDIEDAKKLTDTLKERVEKLKPLKEKIDKHAKNAKIMNDWQKGEVSPAELHTLLQDIAATDTDKTEITAEYQRIMTGSKDWNAMDKDEKKNKIEELNASEIIAITLKNASDASVKEGEECEQAIIDFNMKKVATDMHKLKVKLLENPEQEKDDPSLIDILKKCYSTLDIQFYSVNDFIQMWSIYWDARETGKKQMERRMGAELAVKMGMVMNLFTPSSNLREEIGQVLKSTNDGENNKEKSSYTDLLKSGPATFKEIFEPGGLFETQQFNFNRTRAIMEYAAEHAWIYDLNMQQHTVMGVTLVPGGNLPPGEDVENYIRNLNEANGTGQTKMQKEGEGIVATDQSIDAIIHHMNEQMELRNYWMIYGICKKAIDKAKTSDTSTRLSVAIIRHLRNSAEGRKYMSLELYDQIKNVGLSLPVYTLGFFMQREELVEWQKMPEDYAEESMQFAGHLPKAIQLVERTIRQKQKEAGKPDLTDEEMDVQVSRFLAAQVVKLEGWSEGITIFQSQYKEYRDYYAKNAEGSEATKTDPTYYMAAYGSEVLLCGGPGLSRILKVESTRGFGTGNSGMEFLAQILCRYDQMTHPKNNVSAEEISNYQAHFQAGFKTLIATTFNINDTANVAAFEHTVPLIKNDGSIDENNSRQEKLMLGILRRGLIDKALFSDPYIGNNQFMQRLRLQAEKEGIILPPPAPEASTKKS